MVRRRCAMGSLPAPAPQYRRYAPARETDIDHERCPFCDLAPDPERYAAHVLICDGTGAPDRPMRPAPPRSDRIK